MDEDPRHGVTTMQTFAGIELGGTKIRCGLASADGELLARTALKTESPQSTLPAVRAALEAFEGEHGSFAGVGIGTFGPVRLDPGAADYGHIGATPKAGWRDCDILGFFDAYLDVPIVLDTDVTAAAFGEATWGAAVGCDSVVYITVGTGIGGGILLGGVPVHGLLHPELGHVTVPRAPDDGFEGICPYHGDCVEGMASGPAIVARWGSRLGELPDGHPAFEQTAHYLAHLVSNVILIVSPMRIVLGGGVMSNPPLFDQIRESVKRILHDYLSIDAIGDGIERLIVPPGLGADAGVLGAIAMVMRQQRSTAGSDGRIDRLREDGNARH